MQKRYTRAGRGRALEHGCLTEGEMGEIGTWIQRLAAPWITACSAIVIYADGARPRLRMWLKARPGASNNLPSQTPMSLGRTRWWRRAKHIEGQGAVAPALEIDRRR
jgi:hypothetical protein